MPTRILVFAFALVPAVAASQSTEIPDWWDPPAFIRHVSVGEEVAAEFTAYAQYGVFEMVAPSDGTLFVRVSWGTDEYFSLGFGFALVAQGSGSLVASQTVTAGQIYTVFVIDGHYDPWWFNNYGARSLPFVVTTSLAPLEPCSYTLSRTSDAYRAGGGPGGVDVRTSGPGCPWRASADDVAWVSLSKASGAASGEVTFVVSPNQGRHDRTATLTIAGQPYTITQAGVPDEDADGLPTEWETQFGLDPNSAAGADGALGDPDGDGRSNRQEWEAGTHPRGLFTRYFAEGASSPFFNLRFALLNAGNSAAHVLLQFQKADATTEQHVLEVPAGAVRALDLEEVPRMDGAEFSTIIESDQPVVADRTMTWDESAYGSHAEASVTAPSTHWYLAEGSTLGGLQLFYLLQNPNAAEAEVHVRYLRPHGLPLQKSYAVPAHSRTTLWINEEDFPGLGKALAASDVSAAIEVTNGQPIIVERAMYLGVAGQVFGAGHESAGVTAPALEWFLAEGATGPFFDLYLLVANPDTKDARIEATWLLPDGTTITKPYTVAANSRFTLWVDGEDAGLANTAVSTIIRVTNGVPVVVERAMWWPDGGWYEAHHSPGAVTTGTTWAMADGEVGGPRDVETYILLANTSPSGGDVRVKLVFEDGTSLEKTFAVAGHSRFNVSARREFPASLNRRFGAMVESQGPSPVQLVVERAMYWNARGQFWAAGSNALATRLQ